jgi:uncharacterized membrane protein YtjA (UPF0391 family)
VSSRKALVAVLAFAAVTLALSVRTLRLLNVPGEPGRDQATWALCDFRDTIYYPARAFLEGTNPYDAATYVHRYPVGNPFAPYLPLTLALHLPIALLPYQVAEAVQYVLTIVLTVALARCALGFAGVAATAARVLNLATVLLLSRPGHWNLLLGQPTLEMVLGGCAALGWARTRPLLAALGLAISTVKPTFGFPIAVLMLARGDTRPALLGMTLSALGSLAVAAVLASFAGGVEQLVAEMRTGLEAYSSSPNTALNPVAYYGAIDAGALVSRLLGRGLAGHEELAIATVLTALGAAAMWRLARSPHGTPPDERVARWRLGTMIACLTTVTATHHQAYDWLLLALPLAALVWADESRPHAGFQDLAPDVRYALLALIAVPALNYLSSANALGRLELGPGWRLAVCSLNGAALLAALALATVVALEWTRREPAARWRQAPVDPNAEPRVPLG